MQKFLFLLFLNLFVVSISAQTPPPVPASGPSGIKANLAAGEVTTVNQTDNKIALQTSDGAIDVVITATTGFKRVPPENPVITAAVDTTFSEIGEKDKILVTGAVSADKKTITAKNVYLMSKSDIAKKLATEREAWRTRGISGRVVKVDYKTKDVTISTRGAAGETEVVVSPKDTAEYFRYAANSAKFSDAVASNLAEIKVGDQLRALGDKSPDGLKFTAEKYVSGSFKTVAGKITAIDTAKNEITIEDSANKKPVVIAINTSTTIKQFPPEMAQGIARMMMMSAMGGMQPPQGGQGQGGQVVVRQGGNETRPTNPQSGQPNPNSQAPTAGGNPNGGGQGGQGGPRRMGMGQGGGNLDDMIERLPAISIAQLKIGDTVGISGTAGTDASRYTAIKLLSGVEPFLSIPQISAGGRGNQQPTINIPGLDGGFGNP